MSEDRMVSTAHMRLVKAVAVALAIVLVAPGTSVVASFLKTSVAGAEPSGGIDSARIVSASDAYAALDRLEEMAEAEGGEVPETFAGEVGLLPGARDVRVDEGATVVGYVIDADAQSVYGQLTAHMEERGWTAVPLAGEVGATFVKQEGRYTWVLATCTQAGSATSVVLRSTGA